MKKKTSQIPIIFQGQTRKDKRGSVSFINDFKFEGVKRFYQVENVKNEPIRAFHGHMKEAKYVYVASGAILLCIVKLDRSDKPDKKANVKSFVLSGINPEVVYVPPGFANGFKALKKDTKVIFFSTATLKQSLKDDYRFPFDYWGNDIWKVDKQKA